MFSTNQAPRKALNLLAGLAVIPGLALLMGCPVAVTTYHYDNLRTGWNANEHKLKPSNVSTNSLWVLSLQLDDANDQVDTQPLIARKVHIAGGTHDVVYVATENDNVYAIDADTDSKLLKVNLGQAVPWPLGCGNNGPTVGINGTPAIDLLTSTLYVIAYIQDPAHSNQPEYYVHALDLRTLTDKIAPRLVTASHNLSNNTPFSFQAAYQRQRPGLLLENGNLYAGFGSFCDFGGANSRGWVLGWQAGTLTPLPANDLNNSQINDNMYLSSVWESGFGLVGADGNLFFTTGNSDYSGTKYDGCTNIQESVVRLAGSLVRNCPVPPPDPSLFTPSNVAWLDQTDMDVGSAGVMALPDQSGSVPKLLVANGKDGSMFLLNRNNMGGFTPTNAGALGGVQSIGQGCWCGPTYFYDGSPHVVSSGGNWGPGYSYATPLLRLWNLQTSPSPALVQAASYTLADTDEDTGFFTTVSSHGNANAIIWAVTRPLHNSGNTNVWLHAFKGTASGNTLQPLFTGILAGSWPNQGGNANIVPVVANGKVYVASYRELDIFGLKGHRGGKKAIDRKEAVVPKFPPQPPEGPWEHRIYGTVRSVDGTRIALETREHKTVQINAAKAQESHRLQEIGKDDGVMAAGSYDGDGVLQAEALHRVKRQAATWPADK